jgi:predicted nucleic acid-binding protein
VGRGRLTRTFVDSGVLIAAAKGTERASRLALSILDDPRRVFVTSELVQLEVLPHAIYFQKEHEVAFYEAFFKNTRRMVRSSKQLTAAATTEAAKTGMEAMDALHIAAAKVAKADEFITTEKPTKPLFRVTDLVVKTIHPAG